MIIRSPKQRTDEKFVADLNKGRGSSDPEQNETGSKIVAAIEKRKGRGLGKATLSLIEAMKEIAQKAQPITGRGIGYQLFAAMLIESMSRQQMGMVYRALVTAREKGMIPWQWIVDETRGLEQIATWLNPAQCADSFFYRRDLWQTQRVICEVWSEKGTVRGVLKPVLDEFGVGFRVMHGFSSATTVWEASNIGVDHRPLIVFYVGDWDPSGAYMSQIDLPTRIKEYGGHHIDLRRIALVAPEQTASLPSFSVDDKRKDPRYKWFKQNHGLRCWELDAMDPNVLRNLVRSSIEGIIDRDRWAKQEALQEREKKSVEFMLGRWAEAEETNTMASVEMALRQQAVKAADIYAPQWSLSGL
jgi:hypothetical protein